MWLNNLKFRSVIDNCAGINMSAKLFSRDVVYKVLLEQLQAAAQQLRAGMDVAPAQRLGLEGITAALIASGVDIDALEQMCVTAGTDKIIVVRDGNRLHFDCWQQRAPVYPTTSD